MRPLALPSIDARDGTSGEDGHGKAQHQWRDAGRAGRGGDAAPVGDPRADRSHRHQVRLRNCAVRSVLGAHQRPGAAVVFCPAFGRSGERQDRHHRGPVGRRIASGAEGMGRARCAAMRLLPVRPDHGGRGAARQDAQAHRPGHRRCDDQYLPLRHLSAHPRRGASRGRPERRHHAHRASGLRRSAMTNTISAKSARLSRRTFVVASAAAGGGLALGLRVPFLNDVAHAQGAEAPEVNAWVVIKPDDTTVIRIARAEMGQGTLTGLCQLVAEELECDWSKVTTEYPTPGQSVAPKRAWGDFSTGGSRGIRTSQDYVRRGGAAARIMLMQAAADQWKVPASELTVSDGVIRHAASNRSITYGKVAAAAAQLTPPDPKSITL